MLEKYLIEHCSPTLASLKTANLFGICVADYTNLMVEIKKLNDKFIPKGIEIVLLKYENNRALLYVCRKKQLEKDFKKPGVAVFMKKCGYQTVDVDYAINKLRQKLKFSPEFPHEIGMFLGYPLEDVIGFINNEGKNSKCTGCWKVYCNECQAKKTFAQFEKCRNIYKQLWQNGKDLLRLTVAA